MILLLTALAALCAVVATGIAVWALEVVRALADAANRGKAATDSAVASLRGSVRALEQRHDALHAEFADHVAGLAAPKPVKKAAPREAVPARKKA